MKKKLSILAFGLLLAVGWTNVAQAQLKAELDLESLIKSSPKEGINAVGLNAGHQMKAPNRAPSRATITADKTMTRAEYEAITYDWVDANNVLHPGVKITEPASNPYQIAYLLGTTYMNKNIPGIKYSAFYGQDHPYPNIEFGWDIPFNDRWPSDGGSGVIPTTYNDITISIPSYWLDFDYIYVQSNGTTVAGGSWTAASNGTSLPSGWGGTAELTAENNGCCTQQYGGTIIIPHSIIDGKENVTVVMSARMYSNSASTTNCTVTISGATPETNTYTTTSYTPKTWSINPTAGSSVASGTYYPDGLTIAAAGPILLRSITVYNQNNSTLYSWNYNSSYTSGTTAFGSTSNYYTFTNWKYSAEVIRGYVSNVLIGLLQEHINYPASYLNGNSSIRVVINAYTLDGYEASLVVNGEEQAVTTSAANYTFTVTGTDLTSGTVTPPDYNGYTVFLVKAKDNIEKLPNNYTYSWNKDGSITSLINYFDTYIDEVELLTDGLRLNEGTDDAGTMFSYSGELNKFYFLSKGSDYWMGSSEGDYGPHYGPTYDMYEEFSPTTTEAGDEVTDFYSKLLYGNSYNVKHDCRSVNVMQHYFSMSGNEGTDHKSMTNLIFWIPDNRATTGQANNYDEEYYPHVGLYTITLEAEAQRAADYSESNRMYDVTCDWVSSLNSILDFDVDQDYELWVYIYDEQGNPVADYMVLDRLQMQDLLIHNNTTFTYQVEQQEESQTIVYRVKGWPKDATNNPPRGGDFFALSNLEPVLIPGYENFLSLGVEHYESDFALNQEYNYYRNFLTIGNQNPDNALTAKRIEEGEDTYELYRYDVAKPNELTKAADLTFSVGNNKVNYNIAYDNQNYVDEGHIYNEYNNAELSGYTVPGNLGCPTSGTIANISEGGGGPVITDKYVKVTSSGDLTSGQYLIVYEIDGTSGVAFNGGLTDPAIDGANNNISVTIDNYTIPANSTTNAASFMIDVARGTVQGASGYYIGQNSASNGMLYSNTQYYSNSFSMNGTDGVIQGAGGYQLRFNSASNQNRFRYYSSSSQNAIQLYKRVNTGSDAPTNSDVTFLPEYSSSVLRTKTVDNVTLTTTSGDLGYSDAMRLNGTVSLSTTEGTITKIVFTGSNTSYPVSRLTPASGTYAVANNVGIWTGDASSVSFTASNQVRCSNIIVTVTKSGNGSGSGNDGFTLLNNFLDNSTYTQVGQVVFTLPWKSIQVKLQDEAGTSSGYFMIQNGGKLRFIMPAGYNDANVKFVVHNAPVSSNYFDGKFILTSSTGATQTIDIPATSGYGDRDYEVIFNGISSGDVITITGTHPVVNSDNTITTYNYSPDFKYIHVYVEGGNDGVAMTDALNLDAVKFVDQFKAETKEDKHPYRYGYVLKAPGSNKESDKPEIPVQHTNSTVHGYYSLNDINNDIDCEMVDPVDVMNGEVNMTLSREPEIFYYTLDRKPSNVNNAQWEAVSKLQRREDDSYQEMFDNLPQYEDQICNPPAVTTPPTPWVVERYDNHDIMTGGYNSYMSYVPVIWTHGDQKNRRIKWDIENRHNSYGSPIWKTGVAEVKLTSAIAQRQDDPSTKWTYGGEDCSLYMLDNIEAVAKMPTANNVKYVPYMFRIFVKSNNHLLRGYSLVAADEDPNLPGEHFEGAAINNDALQCVWSGYVNDPNNQNYGVTISQGEENGAKTYTFHKDKVERTNPQGEWDKNKENAIFASLESLIQGEGENMMINGNDLTIVVRFYYLVEGFDASAPTRGEGSDPAGYGVQGDGFTPGPSTALFDLGYNASIQSVTYVNALGMTSDQPFDGVNIVITRYTNGMVTTKKVVR